MISPEALVGLDCLEENSQNPEHEELIASCLEELESPFLWLLIGYGSNMENDVSRINLKLHSIIETNFWSRSWTGKHSRSLTEKNYCSWSIKQSELT